MKISRIIFVFCFLTLFTIVKAKENLPNIVVIMADDVGIGDISCYSSALINTLNIDKLADQGIQFGNYHTAGAVCAPMRYALITGRYPLRTKEVGHGGLSFYRN
ncbi:MAG: arylsulfatase A [Cyclobacteriaceae bacterium]|jgi:arylsulfatase A-like enzyme